MRVFCVFFFSGGKKTTNKQTNTTPPPRLFPFGGLFLFFFENFIGDLFVLVFSCLSFELFMICLTPNKREEREREHTEKNTLSFFLSFFLSLSFGPKRITTTRKKPRRKAEKKKKKKKKRWRRLTFLLEWRSNSTRFS